MPTFQVCNRRSFLAAAGAAALSPALRAQQPQPPAYAPRDWSGQVPVRYPDPDVIALDNRFRRYMIGNTTIHRLYTGTLWSEGPAWNGVGRYLVWSDIPNNVQMRWVEDDGRVTVFRNPSGYSNGNTFDFEGRELSCEHGNRRVVRYEPDGTTTVIADKFQGKRLNSPNDIAVHPDGSIWFTDPTYGIQGTYEGFKAQSEVKDAVYRVDPKTGQMDKVTDDADKPNGICFSPDYKKVYVADTGMPHDIRVYDIDGKGLKNGKRLLTMTNPLASGQNAAADGIRCDVDGNIWAGATPGVQILTPSGEPIGVIRLPENCANISFGGAKRNRLFMAASQSLYVVYVQTAGAHIC
ncbi:MAG: SMP-30/gluconolactonase/LRE family protein [Bryobacterales bacterium]|nr:SMP-30/gluconolactonase/LRE family protein [Bryobacterales bacterium]MBV9398201.1 SMP-30/gluconolactonase/LRE family protein [Bryobacterales bacterium]